MNQSEILNEKPRIEIICADCLEYMKQIPDKSVDLVLTDPPYGLTNYDWDKVPNKEYFDEIFRIGKNQIIFGGNYYDLPKTESWIIWYKRPFLKTQSEAEMAWTSFKIKTKVIEYIYAGNCEGYKNKLRVNYRKKSQHYAEKPTELIRNIITAYTQKRDLILDPFMGSGTTGVACKELNRNFIGIEIESKYYDIAKRRINNAQTNMF